MNISRIDAIIDLLRECKDAELIDLIYSLLISS